VKSGKTAHCLDAIEETMLLDTNILIYACQPGGDWLSPWTTHTDAAIASVTEIEALGFPGISSEENTALFAFIQSCPSYPLDDAVVKLAIKLRQNKRMKLGDAIIAATALEYQIPLITRNEDDFKHIEELVLVNPFATTS
jgi:toxin FitB